MMTTRVPILGENNVLESAGNPINYRHHFLAARHGQRPSVAEVILHVDQQQNVPVCNLDGHLLRTIIAANTAGCDERSV